MVAGMGGQGRVVGRQHANRHAVRQHLRRHRGVRVEGHERALFHREARRLDPRTQHRRRLGEPLEDFRHAEFTGPIM
ncbi:hypothetical protein [Streptomyces sp. NPDC002676]